MSIDAHKTTAYVERVWSETILPTLHDYIRIPSQSPAFDPEWEAYGYMDHAVELAAAWVRSRPLRGAHLEILRIPGRTPVVLIEIAGTKPGTVLLYGHLDKQPPFEGWDESRGLGPWTPVLLGDRLYGRGGADDGYAIFASVAAVEALQAQDAEHPRIVVLVECSEESGSPDLPAYLEAYGERLGTPDLVVCLDSGCGDYERLWMTTSLRGLLVGDLHVSVLSEGVHSGDASGVVPSSFRIARLLLERLEEAKTGQLLPAELHAGIPAERHAEAERTARVLGDSLWQKMPRLGLIEPMVADPVEQLLNRTWRPTLSVTAAAGLPPLASGGNVLRPFTSLRLSLRLPPSVDGKKAAETVRELLERDPPYGARVRFEGRGGESGWEAPPTAEWLQAAVERASRAFFSNEPCSYGEGGSIPFMGMLGRRFPAAQFLITGVLGPHSNAHGPNEFLHVPTAKALTCSVAHVIAELAYGPQVEAGSARKAARLRPAA
jgi:acetylornithine deacetylase/succinyl-diaminopimelate desuccinylase-like protein